MSASQKSCIFVDAVKFQPDFWVIARVGGAALLSLGMENKDQVTLDPTSPGSVVADKQLSYYFGTSQGVCVWDTWTAATESVTQQ